MNKLLTFTLVSLVLQLLVMALALGKYFPSYFPLWFLNSVLNYPIVTGLETIVPLTQITAFLFPR